MATLAKQIHVIFYYDEVEVAMDFKFNFTCEPSDDDPANDYSSDAEEKKSNDKSGPIHLKPAQEVTVCKNFEIERNITVSKLTVGSTEINYLEPATVEEKFKSSNDTENAICTAISAHSDLVAHVYEGGLKIWECSLDLIEYLHQTGVNFTNKTVLELGCGAGLPGIYAAKRGASKVTFQDYNEEVLKEMTVPNVMINYPDQIEEVASRCRFIAGDWSQMENFLKEKDIVSKYDIILTSETIYSIESQPVLHDVIKALLNPSGTVFVAAKTHYFGVGGGTRMFENLVRERGDFTINVCKEYKQGVQREILKMQRIPESDDR